MPQYPHVLFLKQHMLNICQIYLSVLLSRTGDLTHPFMGISLQLVTFAKYPSECVCVIPGLLRMGMLTDLRNMRYMYIVRNSLYEVTASY